MAVLPEEFSMIMFPGFNRPSRSAASIMNLAMRSLLLPMGFMNSSLANTSAGRSATTRRSRTSGVLPMASRTLPQGFR